jgi:hypothetical protein
MTMQMLFDIERSKKVNPPKYGKGLIHLERESGNLSELILMNSKGISLQPREKSLEDAQRTLKDSYLTQGVLYDRNVMVVERRADGKRELVSGYGRYNMFRELDVKTYFWDLVEFESPYWRSVWRRRLNATKDHVGKGTPNTEGTYLKGLVEMKTNNSIAWRDDGAIIEALEDMSKDPMSGQPTLTEEQMNKLLKKFRKSNSKYIGINAFSKETANKRAQDLGCPIKGYVSDPKSDAYNKIGYVYKTGNFEKELISLVKIYDKYNSSDSLDEDEKKIQIVAFIEHTELDEKSIQNARKNFIIHMNNTLDVLKKYFDKRYHDIIDFKGFLAQITTEDPTQEGKPKERGIVDVNGNIIPEFEKPNVLDFVIT